MKVIYGMVFSLVAGFIMGWILVRIIEIFFKGVSRRQGNLVCKYVQNVLAVILAGLHGAQDGQKFMSIAILGMSLAVGSGSGLEMHIDSFPF